MMKRIERVGHFYKITALVLLTLILGLGTATFVSIREQTATAMGEMTDKNRIISDNLAFSIKSAFWSLNWLFVERQMEEITKSDEVIVVELIKPNGEVYLAARDAGIKETVFQERFLKQKGQAFLDGVDPRSGGPATFIITPLEIGSDRWTLIIGLSLKVVEETKKRIIRNNLLLGGAIFLLGAAVAFWLARKFTRPITQLMEGTQEIGKGNLDYRIAIRSRDELGKLADSFNDMAAALQKTTTSRDELAREIAERRQAEKARDEAEKVRAELEERLARSQKMESIGVLAGGVAHDLNNVLSGIVTYPDLILMDLPEDSPLRGPILTMQESGKQAAAIVQDLLTLARRGVTTTKIVNLNDIISDYVKSPEHGKRQSDCPAIDFEVSLEPELLNIKGSSVHLKKTLMNLISNASEAMPGGGKIRIATKNCCLDRPVMGYEEIKEGDFVVLSVEDSGLGIEPGDLKRIFEPFYTKKVMGRSGTGLGMSVIWGTVQDHHGYINVSSAIGRGTTFELFFPVTRDVVETGKQVVHLEDYLGHGESILIVDDVKEQREIASNILAKLRYQVATVPGGAEAIEHLKSRKVDLVVLDMIMDPGIDGLDTYRGIIEMHPGQKAIIASGYSETERVKTALELGVKLYLKKPYTLENMGIAVRDALSA